MRGLHALRLAAGFVVLLGGSGALCAQPGITPGAASALLAHPGITLRDFPEAYASPRRPREALILAMAADTPQAGATTQDALAAER